MKCDGCPYQGTKIIKSTGNRKAEIVIIGEAPHTKELEEGKPFVGRSGEVLNKLLGFIGIDREEVLIGNAIRCKIADKTKTTEISAAIKVCRQYLEKTLKVIKPKLIVCLGDVAQRQVLKARKILSRRGKFYRSEEFDCDVFVTVHPAYVLRGASRDYPHKPFESMNMKEKLLFVDFKFIGRYVMDGFSETGIKTGGYTKVTSLTDLIPILKRKLVAIDFETSNVDYMAPATKLLSMSMSVEEGQSRILIFGNGTSEAQIREVKKMLVDDKVVKIVGARPFEENVAKQFLGVNIGGKVVDVFSMAHVLDENYLYTLENIAGIYTDLKNIKDLAEGQRSNLANLSEDKLIRYNGVDSDATLRSYNSMKECYNREPSLSRYYCKFIQPVQDMLADISLEGCIINRKTLRKNEQEVIELRDKYHQQAIDAIPDPIKDKYKDNLSLTRDALVIDYMFRHRKGLKLKPVILTPKRKDPATSEKHLKHFITYPFIFDYFQFDKANKLEGTYIKRLWKAMKLNDRIYPQTILTRTGTGRTVVVKPEVQTYPKRGTFARFIREAIEPNPGWVLCSRDLDQSELRIIGWLSQDPNILGALAEGVDLHMLTAQRVISKAMGIKKITEDMRQKAKPVNFGFCYGQSSEGFQKYAKDKYEIDFTLEESEMFRQLFFAYPDGYYMLPNYHAKMVNRVHQTGYVESPLGRRRRLPAIYSDNFVDRNEAERQAINAPVQSFSSDLGLLGMTMFWRALQVACSPINRYVSLLWFIHDEILFQAHENYVHKAHALLKECIEERAPEYIERNFKIKVGYPVASSGKIGKNWADMVDYDDN